MKKFVKHYYDVNGQEIFVQGNLIKKFLIITETEDIVTKTNDGYKFETKILRKEMYDPEKLDKYISKMEKSNYPEDCIAIYRYAKTCFPKAE